MTCHSMEDPSEATLINRHVASFHSREKEYYPRLINASTAYMHTQSPKEVFHVEEPSSKENEKSAPKVGLKPVPSHPTYKLLNPDHKYPAIVSAKLDGLQLE